MAGFEWAAWLPCLCAFAAWFGGGIVSVVTGFGCGLFAMPVMLLCIEPEVALPVTIVLCCFSMLLILLKFWRNISWRHFLFCSIFATPGAFLGIWILTTMPVAGIELGFGVFLLCAVASEVLRKHVLAARKPFVSPVVEGALALVAGIINGVCGMGGPALGFYASLAHWDKDMARGTFGLFFGVNLFLCVLLLKFHHLLGAVELSLIGWSIPGAILGTLAGIPLAGRIPQEKFMRLLLLVILISGLVLLYKGLH